MRFRPGHLEYFVVVAEGRQIARAARKLGIAQPTLSHAIAQLEAQVGFKLLDRDARGATLTDAGASLIDRARVAAAAERDALETARSLSRGLRGTIEFGFLGAPPGLDSPTPLSAFAERYPGIDLRYRELGFPTASASSWLAEVDVALCHLPPVDARVWAVPLRREPRVVLAPRHHPLAESSELTTEEVLEETFISLHPTIEPAWAGFWTLDDHRGRPPTRLTPDRAGNPQEVLAALAVRRAITTVPAAVARIIVSVLPSVAAIPLRGQTPARSCCWDTRNGPIGLSQAWLRSRVRGGASTLRRRRIVGPATAPPRGRRPARRQRPRNLEEVCDGEAVDRGPPSAH